MTRRVLTVREQTPVDDAAALLARYRFTALPVVDRSGFLVGIVSEADLVADPAEGRTGSPRTVGGVMTRDVISMLPETDLDRLRHWLLTLGLRVMPITDHRRLVGIVTRMDLLLRDHPVIARFNWLDWLVQRAKRLVGARQRTTDQAAQAPPPPVPPPPAPADVRSAGQALRARHVMTRHPVIVQEMTTVEAAIELLEDYRFTALPVVDTENHLVGIVSGADLLHDSRADTIVYPRPRRTVTARTVGGVMTSDVVSGRPDSDLGELAHWLLMSGRRVIPITDDDHVLVGIVARSDVLRVREELNLHAWLPGDEGPSGRPDEGPSGRTGVRA